MPDENKLQALDDAHFKVKRTCLRCAHFSQGAGLWGTCRLISYEHTKHTTVDNPRQASVPVDGWCPRHETWLEAESLLQGHRRFVEASGFEKCYCGSASVAVVDGRGYCLECADERRELSGE